MKCIKDVCAVIVWALLTFGVWGYVKFSLPHVALPERHSSAPGALRPSVHLIEPSALPDPVARAVEARYPRGRVHAAEKITGPRHSTSYKLEIRDSSGERRRIQCDSHGTIHNTEGAD